MIHKGDWKGISKERNESIKGDQVINKRQMETNKTSITDRTTGGESTWTSMSYKNTFSPSSWEEMVNHFIGKVKILPMYLKYYFS